MHNVNFQGLGSLSQRGGSFGARIEKIKSLLRLLRALQLYVRCSLEDLTQGNFHFWLPNVWRGHT